MKNQINLLAVFQTFNAKYNRMNMIKFMADLTWYHTKYNLEFDYEKTKAELIYHCTKTGDKEEDGVYFNVNGFCNWLTKLPKEKQEIVNSFLCEILLPPIEEELNEDEDYEEIGEGHENLENKIYPEEYEEQEKPKIKLEDQLKLIRKHR